jgi:hypothetical protein
MELDTQRIDDAVLALLLLGLHEGALAATSVPLPLPARPVAARPTASRATVHACRGRCSTASTFRSRSTRSSPKP